MNSKAKPFRSFILYFKPQTYCATVGFLGKGLEFLFFFSFLFGCVHSVFGMGPSHSGHPGSWPAGSPSPFPYEVHVPHAKDICSLTTNSYWETQCLNLYYFFKYKKGLCVWV